MELVSGLIKQAGAARVSSGALSAEVVVHINTGDQVATLLSKQRVGGGAKTCAPKYPKSLGIKTYDCFRFQKTKISRTFFQAAFPKEPIIIINGLARPVNFCSFVDF